MRTLSHRLVLVVLAVIVVAGCAGDDDTEEASVPSALATRTVDAGDVTVEITPKAIDRDGASFGIVFDTHSVELDLDVVESSKLVVDGEAWAAPAWDGAGPGGHHREGTLAFDATGDASGRAVLTIGGLPEPVRATWNLE